MGQPCVPLYCLVCCLASVSFQLLPCRVQLVWRDVYNIEVAVPVFITLESRRLLSLSGKSRSFNSSSNESQELSRRPRALIHTLTKFTLRYEDDKERRRGLYFSNNYVRYYLKIAVEIKLFTKTDLILFVFIMQNKFRSKSISTVQA